MAKSSRILLVEGESDRSFFEVLCNDLRLAASVHVAVPKEFNGTKNTREGLFNTLPTLLNQLPDGEVSRLAAVVDADYEKNGAGHQRTVDRVIQIVAPFGYNMDLSNTNGIVFKHNDGLADIGLWIMPSTCEDGILEDWITTCISDADEALFQHAQHVVAALPAPKFSPIHLSKAEVATWLAWQKKPGHGLYRILDDQLLGPSKPPFLALKSWLTNVFG
jgi:hypothetical protein